MKSIVQKFFFARSDVFKQRGLTRVGNCFLKIDNDILKSFYLFRFKDGDRFDVRFGIAPLWAPSLSVDWGTDGLSSFDSNTMLWYSQSQIQSKGEETYAQIFESIDDTILPMFEKSKDSRTALIQIEAYCKQCHDNWEKYFNHPVPDNRETFLNRFEVYYFLLKIKEKELLCDILVARIRDAQEQIDRSEKAITEGESLDFWISAKERYIHYMEENQRRLYLIRKEDWTNFELQMKTNYTDNLRRFQEKKQMA